MRVYKFLLRSMQEHAPCLQTPLNRECYHLCSKILSRSQLHTYKHIMSLKFSNGMCSLQLGHFATYGSMLPYNKYTSSCQSLRVHSHFCMDSDCKHNSMNVAFSSQVISLLLNMVYYCLIILFQSEEKKRNCIAKIF